MAKTPRGCIPKNEAAALVGYTPGFIMTLARQGDFPERDVGRSGFVDQITRRFEQGASG